MSTDHDRPLPEFPAGALRAIYAQAREEFPSECCGYLLGSGPEAKLVTCINRQDRLHELDPETHPRTSANAYNIGGRELLDLVRSFETEQVATVIYHSHPRVGAYFSEEDTRAAEAAGYPVDYLVVDVQPEGVREAILFRRDDSGEQLRYAERARFGPDA
jgi:proteasome lid subunit RPN8/RPN11